MKKRQLRKNKNKFKIISLFFVILLVAFMGLFFLFLGRGSQSQAKSNKTETSTTTEHASQNSDKQVIYPTIYITGSGGSVTSVDWLVDRLMPIQNVTAKKSLVMIADITKNYQLKVTGQVSKDNKYPLIEFGTGKGTDSGTVFF
ncbi:alpha/beta hydrolase [Lactococcus lactis]|nr:alpha/beta hydrolase [Lactococcus lactis]